MDSYYTVLSEIRNNKQIGGLNIVNIEIKLSQFADDTAILLDGTELSLQNYQQRHITILPFEFVLRPC
jgi:hypothetical protein